MQCLFVCLLCLFVCLLVCSLADYFPPLCVAKVQRNLYMVKTKNKTKKNPNGGAYVLSNRVKGHRLNVAFVCLLACLCIGWFATPPPFFFFSFFFVLQRYKEAFVWFWGSWQRNRVKFWLGQYSPPPPPPAHKNLGVLDSASSPTNEMKTRGPIQKKPLIAENIMTVAL